MAVDQSEILKQAVATLRADATLIALLGETEPSSGEARVFNHVPQDDSKPYVAISWQADVDWDTKDSLGYDGSLEHEVVTIHHSDRDVLKVVDRIRAVYNETPIVITSGKIVCFDYQTGTVPVQVLETHRAIASFNVLVDADGVGGIPVTPPTGGLIVVQDEGVGIANPPHSILDFKGQSVAASDAGGGVACIDINSPSDPQIAWVDNSRAQTYTPDGSRDKPFFSVVDGVASGKPNVFLIGLPSLELLTAPLAPTNATHSAGLKIRAFTRPNVPGFHRHIITFVASDGLVVDGISSLVVLEDITILVLSAAAACVKLANATTLVRFKSHNSQLRTFFAGQFGLKSVATTTSRIDILCTGNSADSIFGQTDLEFDAGMSPGLTEFSGIQFNEGLSTNAVALAEKIRLLNCRLKTGSISGGDAAQVIEAIYCSTGLLAADTPDLLKAADFTGAHSKIVLPVS